MLLTWIKPVSCCDGCLSHRSIPSPLTWYDGRWYSTTAHWAQMLAGASSIRSPWQTTLYSFNPKVLKQHLTQIEVGFVIAEEEGKKMTDGKYEQESEDFHLYTRHCTNDSILYIFFLDNKIRKMTIMLIIIERTKFFIIFTLFSLKHIPAQFDSLICPTLHLHFGAGTDGRRQSAISTIRPVG